MQNKTGSGVRRSRFTYIPGPGNVYGTYNFWRVGLHDPGVPVITYSNMFYNICKKNGAKAQIIQRGKGLEESIVDDFFSFRKIPQRAFTGYFSYKYSVLLFSLKALIQTVKFGSAAVIIGGDYSFALLPIYRIFRIRVILSMHNALWPRGKKQFSVRERIELLIKKFGIHFGVNSAVGTSEECKRQFDFLASGRNIPSSFEIPQLKDNFFNKTKNASIPQLDKTKKTLLFIGRIVEMKGVFDLLSSFDSLLEKHEDIQLVFAGDGAELDELTSLLQSKYKYNEAVCIGRISGEHVHALLESAYLLVCPTRTAEGLALVCVEAMCHGVPVVMSSVVPAADLLQDSCLVFPARSTIELTRKLDILLSEKHTYDQLKKSGLRRKDQFFDRSKSWEVCIENALGCLNNKASF